MSINPEQKPYLKLTPLRMQCLTNFPFIEADFDALTDYQLFCEIVKYLNNVIKNENVVTDNVIALYDAFMQLQEEIEHELAEQNQRIDDYFENTNIQAFVDNKINQMIATNEFQTLLEEAILDINPDALKDVKRINVLDFGHDLQISGVYDSFRDDVFLDDYDYGSGSNKNKVISILNEMLSSGANKYYFVNKSDDESIYRLYCIRLESAYNYYEVIIYYDLHYMNVNNPVVRFTTQFGYILTDNVVTDTGYDGSYGSRTYYTGSGGSGTSVDLPFVVFNSDATDGITYINFDTSGGWYFAQSDYYNFGQLVNDLHSKGIDDMIMYFGSSVYASQGYPYAYFRLKLDYATAYPEVIVNAYPISDTLTDYFNYNRVDEFGTPMGAYTKRIQLGFTVDGNGDFTGLDFNYVHVYDNCESQYLPVDNTRAYTPTQPYHPAVKEYVDNKSLTLAWGSFPYTAGSDFTILTALSNYSSLKFGDNPNAVLYNVQLDVNVTSASLTGNVVVASTPHSYAGFTMVEPSTSYVAYTGIAIVYNNANTPNLLDYYVIYNPTSTLWEIHLNIPSNITLTTGADVQLHMTYLRML